jgi:tellurite resistance protein
VIEKGRRWLAALVAALVITACGDGKERAPENTRATTRTVSGLAAQVTELETSIAEYCEVRSSRRVSRAENEKARQDVEELILLARRHPAQARNALAETSIVLRADCEDSPLQRRVNRALDALR